MLLDAHTVRLPSFAVLALHLLAGMQWVAFAINERVPWASPIADLQCAFVMTQLPVWDESGRCFAYTATLCTAVHWTFIGLTALCVLVLSVLYANPCNVVSASVSHKIGSVNRLLLLLLTDALFVPAVRVLLEHTPARFGWPRFLAGLGALGLLCVLTGMARLLLVEVIPSNAALDARAHGRVHGLLTAVQVATAAVLAAVPGIASQLTLTGLSLAMAAAFWYCQPFYRPTVNAFYVATFSLAAYAGLLGVFAAGSRMLAMMLCGGGALVLLIGYHVTSWRFVPMHPVTETTFPEAAYQPFEGSIQPFLPVSRESGDCSDGPSPPSHNNPRPRFGAFDTTSDTSSEPSMIHTSRSHHSMVPSSCASTQRRYITSFLLPLLPEGGKRVMALCGGIRRVLLPMDVELYVRFLHLHTTDVPPNIRDVLLDYGRTVFEKAFDRCQWLPTRFCL